MKIQIIKGTEKDLDTIDLLVKAAIKKMHQQGNFQWGSLYPIKADFFNDIRDNHLYKAINEDGKIVGICTINDCQLNEYENVNWGVEKPCMVLHRLVIHPEYQKNGIGSQLTMHFEEVARKKGYDYVRVDAYTLNSAANHLYKSLGYSRKGYVYHGGINESFNCYDKLLA